LWNQQSKQVWRPDLIVENIKQKRVVSIELVALFCFDIHKLAYFYLKKTPFKI